MTKTKKKQQQKKKPPKQPQRNAQPAAVSDRPMVAMVAGVVALAVSAGYSFALVLSHLGAMSLPGCGEGSDSPAAQASVWGTVPGVDWPTSHVGLAWFVGLLCAWLVTGARFAPPARWLVRLGVVGSVVLIGAMIAGGYLCQYCLATHAGNIVFWIAMEWAHRRGGANARPWMRAALPGAFAFIVATGALGIAEANTKREVVKQAEDDLTNSIENILQGNSGDNTPGTGNGETAIAENNDPFTGRYLHGPEEAAIRLVLFSDFQCPHCLMIEKQVRRVLAEFDSVSVSMKHFPFCTDCNPEVPRSLHPNACWAARVAEATGIIGGPEAFWKMHDWLFDVKGRFETTAILAQGATVAGIDIRELSAMIGDKAQVARLDAIIAADIAEAKTLGLHFTPMIFVNGVEMKGFNAPNALYRAVRAVAATNPDPKNATVDRPLLARGKYVDDWQNGQVVAFPDIADWTKGDADAPVRVTVWGDYSSSFSAMVEGHVRAALSKVPNWSYAFRHYPFENGCNRFVQQTANPNGCLSSKAVEAAGRIGGLDVYWKMHDWMLANHETISIATVRQAAGSMGIDPDALFAEMESPEVAAAISDDVEATRSIRQPRGARGAQGYPAVVVNGRYIPRWKYNEEILFDEIFSRAMSEEDSRP